MNRAGQLCAVLAKLGNCSNDKALQDIKELKVRGIFIQNPGGGRSTSYYLSDEIE
jgi:hypothetical protein